MKRRNDNSNCELLAPPVKAPNIEHAYLDSAASPDEVRLPANTTASPDEPVLQSASKGDPQPDDHSPSEQTASASIDGLPNEVLSHIFNYFIFEDILCKLRPVCKRWYEICGQRDVWKNVQVYLHQDVTVENVRSLLRYASGKRLYI